MSTLGPVVLAAANQKGGVAETTTATSIRAALAELGQMVLPVGLGPRRAGSPAQGRR